jgi:hypothetical protein
LDDLFYLQLTCKDCFRLFTLKDCFVAFANQLQSFNSELRNAIALDMAELGGLHIKDLAVKSFPSDSISFPNKIRLWTGIDEFLIVVDTHNLLNVFDPTTASIHAIEVGSVSALTSSKNRIILAKHSYGIEIWQFHGELALLKTLPIAHVNYVKGIVVVDSLIYSCGLDGNLICYCLEADNFIHSYTDILSKFIAIYCNGKNVFALSKSGTISKFTATLEFIDSINFSKVVTTAAYNKLIVVATNETIIILNTDLKVTYTRRLSNVTSIAINNRYLGFCCGDVTFMFTIQEFLRNDNTKPGKLFLKSLIKFIDQKIYWSYSTFVCLMT